jgi:polo-like kinase 1
VVGVNDKNKLATMREKGAYDSKTPNLN